MNAAILLMASAVTAGQAPPPATAPAPAAPAAAAPAAPAAPVVVTGSGGCTGDCGPVASGCDVSCKRASLLDKIKSRLGSRKHKCGCEPACDSCAAPAPPPPPAPCHNCAPPPCHDCAAPRVSILDRLKAKFGKKHHCHDCAPAPCDGCTATAAPAHAAPVTPTAPPDRMPATPPATTTPAPKAEVVAPGVVTPVSGPRLNGTTSPY